jgi:putative ATPase
MSQSAQLFESLNDTHTTPLAERLRPNTLADVVGQAHITAADNALGRMVETGNYNSILLWGPPGCGKTTIARILSQESGYQLETVSAVTSSVGELKKIFEQAKMRRKDGKRTLLFVDEIHHFNRSQQDVFLPFLEDGTILLIGATTENPSFELNPALLSRVSVLVLKRIEQESLLQLIARAEILEERGLPVDDMAKQALSDMADGDARYLLNMCELLFAAELEKPLGREELATFIQQRLPMYDKHQDSHYNLISALHKSLRGSDVDAALYWFCRMIDGGENPLYIARRLVRFAVEDIGLADPQALVQANAAKDAYHFLGSPEGELALAQAVVYLATAPKSNASYVGFKAARRDAKTHGSLMPPTHILNAPTTLMKEIGYGKDYAYDHDQEDGFSGQNYFPDAMARSYYYQPKARGFERELIKRLEYWQGLRAKKEAS